MISAIQNATWTVVVSRGQSRNPQKRALEQAISEAAQQMDGVNILVIPHLYDLPKASDSYKKLSEIEGDLIVVSWIYSRAAHWVLDRNGIQGQVGEVELGGERLTKSKMTMRAMMEPAIKPNRVSSAMSIALPTSTHVPIGISTASI